MRGGKEGKERDEAEVRKGDMEKTSRCACSDGAACEPLLRLKLGSACVCSITLVALSVLFVHFLSCLRCDKVLHCLCPQPADM